MNSYAKIKSIRHIENFIWGRFGLDRAVRIIRLRVGVLFSVTNKQKTINGKSNVINAEFAFAPAMAA